MGNKFVKQNNGSDGTPVFNSSLTYLERMNWLMQQAHVCSMDDEEVYDWLMCVEQLHIEIDPRMQPDEQTDLNILRRDTIRRLKQPDKPLTNLVEKREIVRKYHVAVNRFAHSKKLMMKDQDAGQNMFD